MEIRKNSLKTKVYLSLSETHPPITPFTAMFEKSDQKFLRALESPEELEKLLKKLRRGRRWSAFFTAFFLLAVVVLFILIQPLVTSLPQGAGAPLLILPVMLLFCPMLYAMKALSLHGEIRTLLIFKKLRDNKSVVTP